MSKKFSVLTFIIALLALILSGMNYYCNNSGHDTQFVLYLGTNDKDTDEPVFTHDEAKAKLDEILSKHFEGFTVLEAMGGWTNDSGKVSHEYTLVIYLSATNLEKVHKASDELLKVFNQSSVLIQENQTKTEFFSR